MAGIFVTNRQRHGVTVVSNQFIDRFLPEANGEFVKVYLLLLRQAAEGGELSVSCMADVLNNTEKDVLRALKYWEKTGILRLKYGTDKKLQGIILQEDAWAKAAEAATSEMADLPVDSKVDSKENSETDPKTGAVTGGPVPRGFQETAGGKPAAAQAEGKRAAVDLLALQSDEEFSQLLYLAGRYTGKNLSARDCDILANLYSGIGMSAELLEYLIEYCVSNGHKSMRYMETVALNWHERGIRTVEQARAETVMGGKNTYAVLKAFGLGGRNPAAGERAMIDQWFRDYGFSVDVVLEACDRTMRTIHQPSFEYADRILKDWKQKGIREKKDITRLDEKPGAKSGKKTAANPAVKSGNKFHNFTERDYDCDELMKKINDLL